MLCFAISKLTNQPPFPVNNLRSEVHVSVFEVCVMHMLSSCPCLVLGHAPAR